MQKEFQLKNKNKTTTDKLETRANFISFCKINKMHKLYLSNLKNPF